MEQMGVGGHNTNERVQPAEHRRKMIQLTQDLKLDLEKRNKEGKLPKVVFDFFLSAHVSSEDMKGIRKRIISGDVFLTESPGWNLDLLQYFNDVSRGEVDPKQKPINKATENMFYELYGTKKPVGFIDLSDKDLVRLGREKSPFLDLEYPKVHVDGYEKGLENMKLAVTKCCEENMEREQKIISQIVPQLESIVKTNKKLKNNQQLKVTIFLGTVHVSIAEYMRHAGVEATFTTQDPLDSFTLFQKQMLDNSRGNVVEMGRERQKWLLFESFLVHKLSNRLEKVTLSTSRMGAVFNFLESNFSMTEVETVLSVGSVPRSTELFFQLLRQKGLKIPASEEDIDRMISVG